MLEAAGFKFVGFALDRRVTIAEKPAVEDGYILGRAKDGNLLGRIASIASALLVVWRNRHVIKEADVLIARNLDLLLVAWVTKLLLRSTVATYYECLDIHPALTRPGWPAKLLRQIERFVLGKLDGVIISSPAFHDRYFAPIQLYEGRSFVLENKIFDAGSGKHNEALLEREVVRIGYVGILRCRISLLLLLRCVASTPNSELHLYGVPDPNFIPDFDTLIGGVDRVRYFGRYKSSDLRSIYSRLDLIWVSDFSTEGFNATWLLPNRLYEGGFYGCIPIAVDGSETARWLRSKGLGLVLNERSPAALEECITTMTFDKIFSLREALQAGPLSFFVHQPEELSALKEWLLRRTL